MSGPPPRKSLGQNFLRDPRRIAAIVEAVEAGPGDLVLEYGCGRGALTRPLAATGAKVVGVEIDRALLETEWRHFHTSLQVVEPDVHASAIHTIQNHALAALIQSNATNGSRVEWQVFDTSVPPKPRKIAFGPHGTAGNGHDGPRRRHIEVALVTAGRPDASGVYQNRHCRSSNFVSR